MEKKDADVLAELFELFLRKDVPAGVRSAIANEFGQSHYQPAKEALLAGLSDNDAMVRDASIDALANHWQLAEIGPRLVEILENDEQDFVRIGAAQGLGAIGYREALPALKRVILESTEDESLQETAYESVLSILGKQEDDILETGVDKPTVIDWDLVRSL